MAALDWKGGSGSWTDPTQWQNGVVPASPDTAVFNAASPPGYTVTISSPVAVNAVTFSAAGSTLDITSNGALSLGGNFTLQAGTLEVEGTLIGGSIDVEGGTLDLSGGTIANATIQYSYGTMTFGAAETLAGDTVDGTLTLASPSAVITATNGLTVSNYGSIRLSGASDTLDVGGGLTLPEGSIQLSGTADTLDISGGLSLGSADYRGELDINGAGSAVDIEDSETLDNVNIELGSYAAPAATLSAAGGATLTLGANASLNQYGSYATLGGPGDIVNDGTITAGSTGFVIDPGSFTNQGTITVNGYSATLDLAPGDFTNLANGTLSGGTYVLDYGATLELSAGTAITTLDANLSLDTDSQLLDNGGAAPLETSLTTIGSSGTLLLADGRGYSTSNALTVSGQLQLAGGTFAAASLTVAADGQLTGYGTISAPLVDDGTVTASGGTLDAGAVTGTGALDIAAGATLEVGAASGAVSFGGNVATVKLDDPASFSGAVDGLVDGDTIDLADTAASDPVLSGNTLTVQTGNGALSYSVSGDVSGSRFTAASDGAGGTDLTLGSPDFATFIWNANQYYGGNWSQNTNWQYGAAPSFSDHAAIVAPGSYQVTISGAVAVDEITFNASGSTLEISNGSLSLGGSLLLQGGTVAVSYGGTLSGGTVNVEGGTLSIAGTVTGAVIEANGGTIQYSGGTLDGDAIDGPLVLTQYYQDVTVTGGLTVTGANGTGPGAIDLIASGASLDVKDGSLSIGSTGSPGTITVTGQGASLQFDGVQTLDNAIIDLGSTAQYSDAYLESVDPTGAGASLTLGPGVTVNQTGTFASIEYQSYYGNIGGSSPLPSGVINEGTITAGVSGGQFAIDGPFANDGTIIVDNGDTLTINGNSYGATNSGFVNAADGTITIGGDSPGTLRVDGNWSNAGTIEIDAGGTLEFQSPIAATALAGISNNGGEIAIEDGKLTNTGTLTVGSGTALGQLRLDPYGTITGGTIADAGNGLVFAGGTLDGVSYDGTLTIADGQALILENFTGSQQIDVEAGGSLTLEGAYTTADLAGITNSGNLTLAGEIENSGATLTTGLGGLGAVKLTGTIVGGTVDDAGNALSFSGGALDDVADAGTITLDSGEMLRLDNFASGQSIVVDQGATLVLDGDFGSPPSPISTAADVAVDGGSLYIEGGFTTGALAGITNNGGTIFIDGTIANAGQTLDVGGGTSLATVTIDGAISGGTIDDAGGGLVLDYGILDGVSYAGTLTVGRGETLVLEDFTASTLVDVASGGTLYLSGNVAGTAITTADLAGITNNGGTITIDAETGPSTTLDNSGATLTIGSGTALGEITLGYGGIISGGTIDDLGGGLVIQGGTLAGVTYEGTLDLSAGYGATISDGIVLEGAGGGTGTLTLGSYGSVTFDGTQTLDNATVNAGSYNTIISRDGDGTGAVLTLGADLAFNASAAGLTFETEGSNGAITENVADAIVNDADITTNSLTVSGNFTNAGTLTVSSGSFSLQGNLTNSGTINEAGYYSNFAASYSLGGSFDNANGATLNLTKGELEIQASPSFAFTNTGTINIDNGATLYVDNWGAASNTGTINLTTGSTLDLSGDFTTADLAGIENGGGTIELEGTLDNSGGTLTAGTGSLGGMTLAGTIVGGTIDNINDITFVGGLLNNVSFAGTLALKDGESLGLEDLAAGDQVSVPNFTTLDLHFGAAGSPSPTAAPVITNSGDIDIYGNVSTAMLSGITDATAGYETGTITFESGATVDNGGATLSVGPGSALGTVYLYTGATISGGTIVDAGGGLALDGGTLDGVVYRGTLNIAYGYSATISDGLVVETAQGGETGTIVLGGTLTFLGTQTLDNVGISIGNGYNSAYSPAFIVDSDSGGAGLLTLGLHTTISMGGAFAEIDSGDGTGDGIVNQGSINATFTNGGFAIDGASFTDYGTITVGNGTSLKILSNDFTNLTGTTLTGGTYVVDAGSTVELRSAEMVATLDADVTLSGAGATWKNLAQTTLEQSLTAIGSGGALRIIGGRDYTAGNLLTVSGTLQLGGGTLTTGGLAIAANGTLDGYGNVSGLENDGTITAEGGTLAIAGAVTGNGQLEIGAGGEVDVGGATAESVSFGDNVGVLKLDDPSGFGGAITGLIAGDTIDLSGTKLTAEPVLSGNTLTLTTSTGKLTFDVFGDVSGAAFTPSPDGTTGTDLTLGPSNVNSNPGVAKITSPTTVVLPNVHVNQVDGAFVSVENAAESGAGTLNASVASVTGNGVYGSGSIGDLAPGATDATDIIVGASTVAAGAKSGVVVLDFSSGGIALPSQDIDVSGAVYRFASGAAVGPTKSPIVHVGDTASETLTVTNTALNDGYSEDLLASAGSASGGFQLSGATGDIAPGGSSKAITAVIPTTTAGIVNGGASIDLVSDGSSVDGLGQTALRSITSPLSATVNNYANPVFDTVAAAGTSSARLLPVAPDTYSLSFGTLAPDSPKISVDLDLRNLAGQYADLLNGSFTISQTVYEAQDPGQPLVMGTIDNGDIFDQTGFDTFSGLQSPNAALPLEISFDPKGDYGDNAIFSESITLKPTGSNASGYDSNTHLSPITLDIAGAVEKADGAEIELSPKPLNFGDLHLVRPGTLQGSPPAQQLTMTVDVKNGADEAKDADLVAWPGSITGGPALSITGSPTSPLAPGMTSPAAFTLTLPTPNPDNTKFDAGHLDEEFTVGGASIFKADLFHSSPYTSPLPYEDDNYQADVYDFAKPTVYATSSNGKSAFFCNDGTPGQTSFDLGKIDSPVTVTFYASNDAPNSPYSDSFMPTLGGGNGSGNFNFTASPAGSPIAGGTQGVVIGTMTVNKPPGPTSNYSLTLTDTNHSQVAGFSLPLADPTLSFTAEGSSPPPPPPPPPPHPPSPTGGGGGGGGSGGGWGDVHIITYSGLHYDFQAAGEFVLTEATDPSDPFQVQIRLQPWQHNNTVSVTTQLATEVGSDRVTFDVDRAAAGTGFVWDDGAAVTVDAAQPTLALSGGTLTYVGPGTYLIDYNKGETLEVSNAGDYLNYTVTLPASDGPGKNGVTGLDGVNATNPADDLVLGPAAGSAAGTILAQPIAASELYGQYADSWRVSPGTTLFDYNKGENTQTFTDKNFPADPLSINQLPAAVIAEAKALAEAAGITNPTLLDDAILDYAETGNLDFITGNANLQQQGVVSPNVTNANVSHSPPAAAISVLALDTSLTETSASPTTVGFSVVRTGSTASPLAVDYAVAAPGTGYVGAGAFGGTLPSGTVTIAAGDTQATFDISVPVNALGNAPSDLLQVSLSPPSGVAVTVPVAQTEIVNNQPEPGANPPQITLELTSGSGTLTQNGAAWTLDFGNLAAGATPSAEIAVVNSANAPADALSGAVTLGSGSTDFSNNLGGYSNLAAGQIGNAAIVAVAAGAEGAISETLDLSADEVNDSGYDKALAGVTLTVEADLPGGASGGTLAASAELSSATERVALGSGTTVATFTDSDPLDTASDFTATISWGDGTAATIGTVSGSNGAFTVSGGHTYADEGSDALSVTVTRASDDASVTATGTVDVADADVLSGQGASIAATAGVMSGSVTLATFTDTDVSAPSSDFTATINWGDGTATTTGTVSGGSGTFTVSGGHTYAASGDYTATVSLTDDGTTNTATATATATVSPPPGQTFTLTTGVNDILGGAGDDTIDAANNTLNAGDSIDGGGGTNTLALEGGGTFNLGLPTTLANIQIVDAEEGQASNVYDGVTYPSTIQTVDLRAGLDAVVNVASGTPDPHNSTPETINIFGAAGDSSTINLGAGSDTATVGSNLETFHGGGGTDTFIVTAATIGATIDGGTGASILRVSGGGAMSMGANITNIAEVMLASASTAYNFTANAETGLQIADTSFGTKDILVAGGQDQIFVGGGAGKLTANFNNESGVLLKDTAASLNGDTTKNLVDGDAIDFTNVADSGSVGFTYNSGTGYTSMAVSDGSHSASVLLFGQYAASNFTVGADSSGHGTLVTVKNQLSLAQPH